MSNQESDLRIQSDLYKHAARQHQRSNRRASCSADAHRAETKISSQWFVSGIKGSKVKILRHTLGYRLSCLVELSSRNQTTSQLGQLWIGYDINKAWCRAPQVTIVLSWLCFEDHIIIRHVIEYFDNEDRIIDKCLQSVYSKEAI